MIVPLYNAFEEPLLLQHSIRNIFKSKYVDHVVVVYQHVSHNHQFKLTEKDFAIYQEIKQEFGAKIKWFLYQPNYNVPYLQETVKRNVALQYAIELNKTNPNYSHYLVCDGDEFHDTNKMDLLYEEMLQKNMLGAVVPIRCYYRTPELCGPEGTLALFIQKIFFTSKLGRFLMLHKEQIDPTRQTNVHDQHYFTRDEYEMDHFTAVRSNLSTKIKTSSSQHLFNEQYLIDYANACDGYYWNSHKIYLKACANKYDLPTEQLIDYEILNKYKK